MKALRLMRLRISIAAMSAALCAMFGMSNVTQAGDWDWDDIEAPYRHRLDTQTSSSGNAQRVNTITHIATPWPRNVRNRHIPANGERMVGAIRRYQDGGKERLPLARKSEEPPEMDVEPPLRTFVKTNKSSSAPSPLGGLNLGGTKGGAMQLPTAEMGKSEPKNTSGQPDE